MASAVGSRLGHYAVSAKFGEGGMGEVPGARDITRLPVPPLPDPMTTTNRLRNEVAVLREEVAILREEVEWLIEAEEIRVFIYRLKQNRAAPRERRVWFLPLISHRLTQVTSDNPSPVPNPALLTVASGVSGVSMMAVSPWGGSDAPQPGTTLGLYGPVSTLVVTSRFA